MSLNWYFKIIYQNYLFYKVQNECISVAVFLSLVNKLK